MTDYPGTTSGGYFCNKCQSWATYDSIHICPALKSASYSSPIQYYGWDSYICQLLERIAVALEKIVGVPTAAFSVTNEPLPNKESHI